MQTPELPLEEHDPQTQTYVPRIKLDWKAYFTEFCERHGEPVRYKGRLLFDDGWMYSATDYAGPEWEPPADKATRLQLQQEYWQARYDMVMAEANGLRQELTNLTQLERVRQGAPLQQRVVKYKENDQGLAVACGVETIGVDLEPLQSRLNWLESELENCDSKMADLETQLEQTDAG